MARGDVVALADVGREALALQRDGVQTQVDQDAHVVRGHDDVGVRQQFQQLAADRGDGVDDPARRVDGGAVAHHALREHGVGNVLERNCAPRDRGEDGSVSRAHLLAHQQYECDPRGLPFAGSRLGFPAAWAAATLRTEG